MVDDTPARRETRTITMQASDVHYFYMWSRLEDKEKEALLRVAELLGEERENVDSLRQLLTAGKRIVVLLSFLDWAKAIRDAIIKLSMLAGAISALVLAGSRLLGGS